MDELGDLMLSLQFRYSQQLLDARQRMFKSASLIADIAPVLAIAPVPEADGMFDIDTAPKPPKKSWRWSIAARWGASHKPRYRLRPRGFIADGLTHDQREALKGHYVEDLIACDPALLTVTARYACDSAVCGAPAHPGHAEGPVFAHETPLAWLMSRGSGVFLCGDQAEQQAWLRGCTAGLTTATVAMGEAILKKMRRPIPALPQVRVYA